MCRESKDRPEKMCQRDAEIAVALMLVEENPDIDRMKLLGFAEEFIRKGRHVNVLVNKNGRKGTYWSEGDDPYRYAIL